MKNELFCGKTNYLQIKARIAKNVHLKDVPFEILSMTNIETAPQFDLNWFYRQSSMCLQTFKSCIFEYIRWKWECARCGTAIISDKSFFFVEREKGKKYNKLGYNRHNVHCIPKHTTTNDGTQSFTHDSINKKENSQFK